MSPAEEKSSPVCLQTGGQWDWAQLVSPGLLPGSAKYESRDEFVAGIDIERMFTGEMCRTGDHRHDR